MSGRDIEAWEHLVDLVRELMDLEAHECDIAWYEQWISSAIRRRVEETRAGVTVNALADRLKKLEYQHKVDIEAMKELLAYRTGGGAR